MSTDEVGAYYDRLGSWNRVARAIGYGGGHSTLTVHRALADPRAGGRPTYTRLHDVIVDALPGLDRPRVLDAGCGRGGTMIDLATRVGASCIGLTLSASQAGDANAAAARRRLDARVRAEVRSYDDPPDGPFDLIVAVESLVHSPCPSRSVAALARVLAPGGRFVIVDDMPQPGVDAVELAAFKAGWHAPALWSRTEYLAAFARERLEVVVDADLSAACRPRGAIGLAVLRAANRIARLASPPGLRAIMDSHYGGLELERLIRSGRVGYRLLVARRGAHQVS